MHSQLYDAIALVDDMSNFLSQFVIRPGNKNQSHFSLRADSVVF